MDSNEQESDATKEELRFARQVTGRTRFIASVPAIGLLIAAVVLAIATLIGVVVASFEYVIGDITLHDLTIDFIESADAFLLAVALYILSIGLVSLFISDEIPLPEWLEFHDFDELKERLTSVIIVMLGVSFLGLVMKGAQGIDTLWTGLGSAAIIVALAFFMGTVFKSGE